MEEMNKVCDIIYQILSDYDVILYRNDPNTYIEDWSRENHFYNIDLHFAIHSNGSSGAYKKGIENWIHDSYSPTYSLAYKIYSNLYSIYPYNDNPLTDRGVKYAKGSIAETNPSFFNFGILLEIAYHDNLEDANWIINNRKQIAKNISQSIIDYYQLRKR